MTTATERDAQLSQHPGLQSLRRSKGEQHTIQVRNPNTTVVEQPSTPVTTDEPIDNSNTNTSPQDPLATEEGVTTESGSDPVDPTSDNDTVDWKKRHDDGRTYQAQLQAEINELKSKLESQGNDKDEDTITLPKSDAELEAWKNEHPQMFDSILTLIRKEGEPTAIELKQAKDELQAIKAKTRNEALFHEVLKVHPDASDIRNSDKFKQWFSTQSTGIKSLIESTEKQEVITGIDIYKREVGITTPTAETKPTANPVKSAEAASAVQTNTTVPTSTPSKEWTDDVIKRLTPTQFAAHRSEIMAYRAKVRQQR